MECFGATSSSLEVQAGNRAGGSTKLVRPGGWLMFLGLGIQPSMASAPLKVPEPASLPPLFLFNPCLVGRQWGESLSEVPSCPSFGLRDVDIIAELED